MKNIRTGTNTDGSTPQQFVRFGAHVYFAATTPATGRELWRTDGTAAGTVLFKDINPGPGDSEPERFLIANNFLFFFADDGTHGVELWRTDGTAAGTILPKDVTPGRQPLFSPSFNDSAAVGTNIFFAVGFRLWKSNGTPAGTVEVFATDITIAEITNLNAVAIFSGDLRNDTDGEELWKSDGTSAGTVRVKDINAVNTGSDPTGFRTAGTLVYFQADSPAPGLWKSDGTDAGTQLVANLGNAADPIPLGAIGNTMFFSATVGLASEGRELWKTQGTAATTTLVKDINPTSGSFPSAFTEFNGMGYFDAITSALGRELWKTDGTEAGTTLVKDCRTGSQDGRNGDIKVVFNNALYFGARNAAGPRQLWKTDGTTTVELSSSLTSSNFDSVNWIAALNNAVVFNGSRSSDGNELWKSDGTTGGTVQVKDIVAGDVSSHPAELTDVDGTLFFVASDASLSPKLWKSDGTDAGTVMVKDVPAENLVAAGNTLFFTSPVGFGDTELWKSDGTNAGTVRVKDIRVGTTGSGPSRGVEWNGLLYFTANNGTDGRELWRSDGTETGTVMVVNIAAGNADPDWLTPAGGLLYFAANHPTAERELFKTDGTAAGTVMVEDLNLSGGSHPSDLVMHGTQLFFTASDGSGTDLYKSDGTAAGTAIISMSLPGLTPVRSLAGFLFLLDNNPLTTTTVGAEPWKSDGSVAGTVLIEDIFAGVGWSGVEGVVRTSTTGFFAAADATAGRELWKTTDGTPAGTSRIADISPGLRSSNPSALMTTVGQAVFAADDGTNGNELWMSNGTTASMIHNITSGAGSSPISSIVESGPFLFFDADDGTTGVELWALPMSRLCTPPATPTITSSSPAGICVGQSVTLTAPLGYTRYQWNTGATTRAITVSPTVTTQYSVVGYNATDCPSARATHTVNVGTPLTAVSISHSGSTNVCYTSGTGGTFTVTDTGGGTVTHQWGYRNSSGTGTITNIPGETGTSYILTGSDFPSPGAYYIVVRSTPFCGTTTESNQTQISVRPPLTVATMSITGSSQVCSTSTGGTASVSTTGGDALTYQWRYRYTPTGGFQTITGATAASYVIRGSDFVPEASGPQTYFLSCLVTPACGAVRETNQNSVTVTPTPTTPSASNNGPICQGAQLQLNSSTVAGATYAWTGPNGFASALQNPTIPNASTAASGEYRVVVTVNGCPSSAGTTNVTVRPVPTANPASNSPVCEGSTLTLSTPLVTGATYSWTGPNGFTSTSRTPSIPSVTPAGGGSYTVLSTLNGCSSAPQSTDVTVNARPVVTATNSGPVCEGQAASLGATFVAGATYAWTGPNGFSSNAQNPSISDAGLSHAGTYSVVASVAGCQSPASPTTLEVNSRPSASIDAYPSVTAGAIANASVLDAGTGATYVWSITNGIIEGGQGTRNIFFTPGANGSVQLNIVVTAASGCSAQDSVAVPIVAVPLINNFNPGSGAAGASIQISGSNFVDVLAVRFNGRASEFEVLSPTSIRATVASSATSGPISVITTTGTGNSATDFVVLPRITALTPTIGRTGSWVTVTGTNLLQTSGINFGGMGANFTVLSASSVEAMVPLGATNGPIQLHTPDASTASLSDFTIEPVPYMLYTRFQVPCRLLDTRLSGGRLLHETPRIFDVVENLGAQGGNADDCGVPGNATAAMINFVAVSPTAAGNLRAAAYPKSIPPTGSIINYQSTTPPLNVANGVIFPICDSAVDDCAAGDIVIQANGGDTHLVADVLGYFTRFVRESVRPFALVRRLSSPIPLSTSCSTLMQTELHTPAEGIVVISGHATVRFAHVNGTTDEVQVTAGGSFDGCSSDPEKVARVDASEPTGTYYRTIPLHAFGLFQFGYKEFYVRGRITLASSGHSLHNAAFSVTFYPE